MTDHILFGRIAFYIILMSLIAVGITVYDKIAAKRRRRRIPEKTLLTVAAIGGAAAMLLTMLLIRHKTRHYRFMIGLPLILLIHCGCWLFFRHILTTII